MNNYIKCNNDDEVFKCQEFFMKKKFKWDGHPTLDMKYLKKSNFCYVTNRPDLLPVYFKIFEDKITFFNRYIENQEYMFGTHYKIIEFKKFLRINKLKRIIYDA